MNNNNTNLWNKFYPFKLEEATANAIERENKTGKPAKDQKATVNQYKVGVTALDAFIQRDFKDVTAEELEQLDHDRDGKNINHVRGFLITCISQGWIEVGSDTIIYLIPKELRIVASKLLTV